MRILFSEDKEASDYIIQNYLGLPIYVDKTDKECTITMKNYTTKFAYFGAENSYIFNSFFSVGKKMLNLSITWRGIIIFQRNMKLLIQ